KRGNSSKRTARTRTSKHVAAKKAPKKQVTKTGTKRVAAKKSPINAPEPAPQQADAAAETTIAEVAEEPVASVTVSELGSRPRGCVEFARHPRPLIHAVRPKHNDESPLCR